MTQRNALFIANKQSGKAENALDGAVKILKDAGMNLIEYEPENPDEINELIRDHRDKVEAVILAGGDGTLSSAAATLAECDLALGILPMGTANDLARTLKIPQSPEDAAGVIAGGRLHRIDLGVVNEHCFVNAAHIGLGVKVNRTLTPDFKSRWGRFSYARGLIAAFKLMHSFRADIICDGQAFSVRSIHITVANGHYYGGGMALSQEATVDDHKLSIFSLEPQSFLKLLSHSVVILGGELKGREGVWLRNGEAVRINTSRPMDIYADGEYISRTPAHFDLQPNRLQVFVPYEYFSNGASHDAEN